MELHIANAAYDAGFNTCNHEALFNLIWAVKRTAIQTLRLSHQPFKPRHPTYPDRYRPSGIGDNTARKRKSKKKKRQNPNLRSNPRPVHPLIREADPPVLESGKRNLDLVLDAENVTEDGPSKRQKTRSSPNTGRELLVTSPMLTFPVNHTPKSDLDVVKTLSLVKTKLQDARRNMNSCQDAMKKMFDQHAARFDGDEIMTRLQNLSTCMNSIFDGGRDGAVEIDFAFNWLRSNAGVSVNDGDMIM